MRLDTCIARASLMLRLLKTWKAMNRSARSTPAKRASALTAVAEAAAEAMTDNYFKNRIPDPILAYHEMWSIEQSFRTLEFDQLFSNTSMNEEAEEARMDKLRRT